MVYSLEYCSSSPSLIFPHTYLIPTLLQIPSKYSSSLTKNWSNPTPTSLSSYFTQRELSLSPTQSSRNKRLLGDMLIPNSSGVEVSQFTSKVYSGQYSNDGTFFYTACQDFWFVLPSFFFFFSLFYYSRHSLMCRL